MIRVIIQPRDGIKPLLEGVRRAKESVEIVIYRLDRLEIEQELKAAAVRGVAVHALVSYTNRGDEAKDVRKLAARLGEAGVKVSQTADDFIRYHNKMMVVDRREFYLLTFNYTFLDIHHSRSLGIITDEREVVEEAARLFAADAERRPYQPGHPRLIVSPESARAQISDFIRGARRQLLIYDGKLNDARILLLLQDRARAGVEVKIIGATDRRAKGLAVQTMPLLHLHAQAIIRDGEELFLGSQSLRKAELDERREVGMLIRDPEAVRHISVIFELDWGDIVVP
jgi:phosphatidylserine/phosphatidylglycerophosphate/cardiolipin synthase-like enzyme